MKTISELRQQFEYEYYKRLFYLERNSSGEYRNPLTFQAWGAYKLCALLNGVIDPGTDIFGEDAR